MIQEYYGCNNKKYSSKFQILSLTILPDKDYFQSKIVKYMKKQGIDQMKRDVWLKI